MLSIFVHDIPATQGSKKSFTDRGGHVRTVEDNRSALMQWRGRVADAVHAARLAYRAPDGTSPYQHPLEGPVVLALTMTLPKPVSKPKRKPCWPLAKRDVDKLERAILDALTAGGAYVDDGQVIEVVRQAKRYPDLTAPEPYAGDDIVYMLDLSATERDVLDHPGAVIRLAHWTEVPAVRKSLADAGFDPKDITGGW